MGMPLFQAYTCQVVFLSIHFEMTITIQFVSSVTHAALAGFVLES